MHSYTAKSFEKCVFNPLEKELFKKYPELIELRPEGDHSEKVVRYILFLYDPKSPLIKDIRNITARKQEAARQAGFNLETDSNFLDGLFTFANKEAVEATCLFLRNQINQMLWSTIVVHEQMYYEYHAKLMTSIEDKKAEVTKPKKSKKKEPEYDDLLGDDDFEDPDDIALASVNQKDVYQTVVLKEKLREGLKSIYRDLQMFYKEMYPDDNLREAVTGQRITPETMSRV